MEEGDMEEGYGMEREKRELGSRRGGNRKEARIIAR